MKHFCYDKYSDSIALPKLFRIKSNLFVASFILMKLLPVKYVLEKALAENKIRRKSTVVVETSSGTYALGLAIICREQSMPFRIVTDSAVDAVLKRRLEMLGGEVEIVESQGTSPQMRRLEAVHRFLKENQHAFWPQQYDNPEHLDAYAQFADFLVDNLGDDFTLVASVGSGSSSCGTIKQLRKHNPSIPLVGVDTFGSVLFGLENGYRLLRGLGNSLIPKNLMHAYFDHVHWTSPIQAFQSTREFFKKTAIFAGPTTGACYHVADWIAAQDPTKKILFISPDEGHRYVHNVYDDEWMLHQGLLNPPNQKIPVQVNHPDDLKSAQLEWAWMEWKRRSLEEVRKANG